MESEQKQLSSVQQIPNSTRSVEWPCPPSPHVAVLVIARQGKAAAVVRRTFNVLPLQLVASTICSRLPLPALLQGCQKKWAKRRMPWICGLSNGCGTPVMMWFVRLKILRLNPVNNQPLPPQHGAPAGRQGFEGEEEVEPELVKSDGNASNSGRGETAAPLGREQQQQGSAWEQEGFVLHSFSFHSCAASLFLLSTSSSGAIWFENTEKTLNYFSAELWCVVGGKYQPQFFKSVAVHRPKNCIIFNLLDLFLALLLFGLSKIFLSPDHGRRGPWF